ncbi:hypothetical protein K449DRAFT_461915 [Hypoxylon sp. EC38]|nr:hypothetical protein K449DRAFT_461915 [Hypoxylon sp. EC38]
MSRPLPDLEVPNAVGACWTCVDRANEELGYVSCDKTLPACKTCVANGRVCEGYHARLKWPPSLNSLRQPVKVQPVLYTAVSSLGLPPDENRLLQHYLRNFSRISLAVDYDGNGWRRLVGIGLSEPALQNALLATSEAHLSRLQQKDTSQSHVYLRRSLQLLQFRFERPDLLRSEITLMVLLALLVYELCEGTERWKQHFKAIVAWFQSRDDFADVDPFLTTFISMIACQAALHAKGEWRRRSHVLLDRLLPLSGSQNAIEVVFGGYAALPQLIVEAGRLEDDFMVARALSDQDQMVSIFNRAEELQSRIKSTQILSHTHLSLSLLGRPGTLASTSESLVPANPFDTFSLDESVRCSAEILRYALHIYTHRIIHDPLSTSGPSPLVDEAVSESLRILPIVPDTDGPGMFLGWALVVIGAEIDNLDQRAFIKRRLESLTLLSVNHGILALEVLGVVWRRRDDLIAGKSLCRRVRWQDVMHDMAVDQALV